MSHYPKFQEAIKSYVQKVPTATYWRYVNGHLPSFGRLITTYPDLVIALAEDAKALQTQRNRNTAESAPEGLERTTKGA